MPTSAEEARNIVHIMNDYLSPEQAKEITKRLDAEVGAKTDNMSLKVSLQMLKALYEPPPPIPRYWKALFYLIVGFHMAVLAGNVVALFLLPFLAPWYIALPVMSLLVNFMFSAVSCPLTRLESVVRRRLGWPEIRYFIQHYFFKPSWRRSPKS